MRLPTDVILGSKVRNPKPLHDRGGPIPVHFAASSCHHSDCAQHYDLSMACLRARIREASRVTFGETPTPLYVDALCGTTHLWLMPDRYAEGWARSYRSQTGRHLCARCERVWRKVSGQPRAVPLTDDESTIELVSRPKCSAADRSRQTERSSWRG